MPQPTANYTGSHSWPEQAIANYILGQHGTIGPTNPEFVRVGGQYLKTPAAAGTGADLVFWADARGYLVPHIDAFQLFSTTTAGTQTTTTAGTMLGLGAMRQVSVQLSLTTQGATVTLDCYLDSRFDGTNWINVARFPAFTANGIHSIILTKQQGASVLTTGIGLDAGAGTIREIGFADDLRARYTWTGTAAYLTFTLYVNAI